MAYIFENIAELVAFMIVISLGMWALFYWVGCMFLVTYHFYMMYILYEGYNEVETKTN